VDDDLIVPAEPPERLLGSRKVQQSGDVGCPVLLVAQGVYQLQGIATVQLFLEFLCGDQSYVHPSRCTDEGLGLASHLQGAVPGGSVSVIWCRWLQTAIVIAP
jgi:hypothetical protein